jgi:outer membrane protein assembly factor BamC
MSDLLPDRKVEYKKQRVAENDLEVPPDLTKVTIGDAMPIPGSGDAATYSQYESGLQGGQRSVGDTAVLPKVPNIQVMRDGNQRWLEIQAPADQVWPLVVSFWRENGVLLVEQDPTTGVMKTDWLENRADIKQGFITDFLRKALDSLYSAATRDQFRVRLEPGMTSGTTDLYLTHRGMEEQVITSAVGNRENSYWVPRPNDPDLEAEMLRRIMIYLGVAEKTAGTELAKVQAKRQARSALVKGRDGGTVLLLNADLAPAWRLVGIALERVGFAVEDRDRLAGQYYVRYDDPTKGEQEGFFDKLAFWRGKKKTFADALYRIHLEAAGAATRVVVLDSQGRPEQSETAVRILTLLQEQIR